MQEQTETFDEPEITIHKQVDKKPLITPFRIMVGLALFFLLIVGSYQLYSAVAPAASKSAIEVTNDNIRSVAGSQNGKSSSGSSSSKSSKSSDRPKEASQVAGKSTIANTPLTNGSQDGGDEEDSNDGDKNKKILDSDKKSDGSKTGKGDTSTDEDEESLEEDSEEYNVGGLAWPDRNQNGATPLIGNARK